MKLSLEQCRQAVELADALAELREVRRLVVDEGHTLCVSAQERDDDGEGTIFATIEVPGSQAASVLDPLEGRLKAELQVLGIDPDAEDEEETP